MVPATTTYFKINEMKKPWRVVQGGQGAGKNWAIAQELLNLASEKKRTITIVTDTFENLKDGIIKDYQDMFSMTGLVFEDYFHGHNKNMKWGDSTIQFRYVVGHKGQAGKSKRRDVLYVNETTKVAYSSVEHYIARTAEICFFDLNPDFETWTHTQIEPDERCEKIIVTYRDNEFCPQGEIDFIEGRKDNEEWYRVYGLGLTGTYSDRRVYQFKIIDQIPSGIKRTNSGMDFGVSPDPTFLVDTYTDKANLYISQVFTETGLMPERIRGAERLCISDKMAEVGFRKGWRIGCDSSGAVEIKDLKKHGYNADGVKKGTGSVIEGIKKLKSFNIHVTRESEELIKGFENWFWKVDHNGKIIPEPKGHEPDGLAASRYAVMSENRSTTTRINAG